MRLPRTFTMSASSEFARVREQGEAKPGRYIVLSTLSDSDLEHIKVGLITTKKAGKAHTRNLLRRRFRSIIQKYGEQLQDQRYIVTIARWRAAEASYKELEADWIKTAKRLGILNPSS